MPKRLLGVLLLALLATSLLAAPALATEVAPAEGGEVAPAEGSEAEEAAPPDIDEICSANDVVSEYCPEPYEAPSVFTPIVPALVGAGAVIALALFGLYVRWLPNFAQERKVRAKGRR